LKKENGVWRFHAINSFSSDPVKVADLSEKTLLLPL